MAWKTTLEQLKRAQAISHEKRRGKPLSEEVKAKLRERALLPERIAISINNLPKYKKGDTPIIGRKWSKEQREKLLKAFKKRPFVWNKGKHGVQDSSYLRGENHWKWKGGITPINKKIRSSLEYKLWRESVFKRDNWTCQICKQRGRYLEVDHIKPFALFPELRFLLNNGRTLCKECHRGVDTSGRSKLYRKNDNTRVTD